MVMIRRLLLTFLLVSAVDLVAQSASTSGQLPSLAVAVVSTGTGADIVARNLYSAPAVFFVVRYRFTHASGNCLAQFQDTQGRCQSVKIHPFDTIHYSVAAPTVDTGKIPVPGKVITLESLQRDPDGTLAVTAEVPVVLYQDGAIAGDAALVSHVIQVRQWMLQDAQDDLDHLQRALKSPNTDRNALATVFEARLRQYEKAWQFNAADTTQIFAGGIPFWDTVDAPIVSGLKSSTPLDTVLQQLIRHTQLEIPALQGIVDAIASHQTKVGNF
jgi:hypothetical protein